jgi:hypothetical protein
MTGTFSPGRGLRAQEAQEHHHQHAAHAHGAMTPSAPLVWSLSLASLAIVDVTTPP